MRLVEYVLFNDIDSIIIFFSILAAIGNLQAPSSRFYRKVASLRILGFWICPLKWWVLRIPWWWQGLIYELLLLSDTQTLHQDFCFMHRVHIAGVTCARNSSINFPEKMEVYVPPLILKKYTFYMWSKCILKYLNSA